MDRPDQSRTRTRVLSTLIALALVPLGLLCKESQVAWVAAHLGGTLYVAFFYFLARSVHPEGRRGSAACLLYTSPSPRDATLSRMPSSA